MGNPRKTRTIFVKELNSFFEETTLTVNMDVFGDINKFFDNFSVEELDNILKTQLEEENYESAELIKNYKNKKKQ